MNTKRRSLLSHAGLALAGTLAPISIAAAATSLPSVVTSTCLDAELLALCGELTAAVTASGYDDTSLDMDDDELTEVTMRLTLACWAIIEAPPAQTPAGHALKAAAAMHQLRFSYSGGWGGDGEKMAWLLLSEMAGDAYVPLLMPARLRATEEPARA